MEALHGLPIYREKYNDYNETIKVVYIIFKEDFMDQKNSTIVMEQLKKDTDLLVAYAKEAMTKALGRDYGALDPEEAAMFTVLINLLNHNVKAMEELTDRMDRIEMCKTTKKV